MLHFTKVAEPDSGHQGKFASFAKETTIDAIHHAMMRRIVPLHYYPIYLTFDEIYFL
jgi:hypothetical protein